jgi:hypothetical protein
MPGMTLKEQRLFKTKKCKCGEQAIIQFRGEPLCYYCFLPPIPKDLDEALRRRENHVVCHGPCRKKSYA